MHDGDQARSRGAVIGGAVLCVGLLAASTVSVSLAILDVERFDFPQELALHLSALAAACVLLVARREHDALAAARQLAPAALGFALVSLVGAMRAQEPALAVRALALHASAWLIACAVSALAHGRGRRALRCAQIGVVVVVAASVACEAHGAGGLVSLPGRGPGGFLGIRNHAAQFIAIGVPGLVALAVEARARSGPWYAVAGVAIALCAHALVLTRARTAWLALIAVGAAVVAVRFVVVMRNRSSVWRRGRTTLALVCAGLVGAWSAVALPNRLTWHSDTPYRDSLAHLVDVTHGTGLGRAMQASHSLRIVAAHPFLGVGAGGWSRAFVQFAPDDPSVHRDVLWPVPARPSCDAIDVVTTRGIAGLACAVWLVVVLARMLAQRAVQPRASGDDDEAEDDGHPVRIDSIAALATLLVILVLGGGNAVWTVAPTSMLASFAIGAWIPRHPGDGDGDGDGERDTGAARSVLPRGTLVLALVVVIATTCSLCAAALCGRQVEAAMRLARATTFEDEEAAAALFVSHARIEVWRTAAAVRAHRCVRAQEHARRALAIDPQLTIASTTAAACRPEP